MGVSSRIANLSPVPWTRVRPLRPEFSGTLYHVSSRGDRQEEIYEDDDDRQKFLEILASVVTDYNWSCHAYCLMSNHYHLVIETHDGNLSKGMRQLNGVFTQASNRRHRRCGHLFQGRYKAILIDKDNYLLELTRYVVLNPTRARGMVRRIEDWPWSSYPAMVGTVIPPEWLTTDWVLSQFGRQKVRAMKKYRQFVMEGLQQKPDIWSELKGQIYLGDDTFVSNMQKKIGKDQIDLNIPQKQMRPIPRSLAEIVSRSTERDVSIIAAYDTGAYSQREIGDYFGIHPSTVGVVVRKHRNSQFAT